MLRDALIVVFAVGGLVTAAGQLYRLLLAPGDPSKGLTTKERGDKELGERCIAATCCCCCC